MYRKTYEICIYVYIGKPTKYVYMCVYENLRNMWICMYRKTYKICIYVCIGKPTKYVYMYV